MWEYLFEFQLSNVGTFSLPVSDMIILQYIFVEGMITVSDSVNQSIFFGIKKQTRHQDVILSSLIGSETGNSWDYFAAVFSLYWRDY